MSTPEGAVLRACMSYLALNGIAAWRINTMGTPLQGQPGRFRPAPSRGIADILGICACHRMGGYPLAVECKSATGRQSPAQAAFAREWEAAGGLYLLVRSAQELGEKLRDAGVETRVR